MLVICGRRYADVASPILSHQYRRPGRVEPEGAGGILGKREFRVARDFATTTEREDADARMSWTMSIKPSVGRARARSEATSETILDIGGADERSESKGSFEMAKSGRAGC